MAFTNVQSFQDYSPMGQASIGGVIASSFAKNFIESFMQQEQQQRMLSGQRKQQLMKTYQDTKLPETITNMGNKRRTAVFDSLEDKLKTLYSKVDKQKGIFKKGKLSSEDYLQAQLMIKEADDTATKLGQNEAIVKKAMDEFNKGNYDPDFFQQSMDYYNQTGELPAPGDSGQPFLSKVPLNLVELAQTAKLPQTKSEWANGDYIYTTVKNGDPQTKKNYLNEWRSRDKVAFDKAAKNLYSNDEFMSLEKRKKLIATAQATGIDPMELFINTELPRMFRGDEKNKELRPGARGKEGEKPLIKEINQAWTFETPEKITGEYSYSNGDKLVNETFNDLPVIGIRAFTPPGLLKYGVYAIGVRPKKGSNLEKAIKANPDQEIDILSEEATKYELKRKAGIQTPKEYEEIYIPYYQAKKRFEPYVNFENIDKYNTDSVEDVFKPDASGGQTNTFNDYLNNIGTGKKEVKGTEIDKQAYKWAMDNPNDPKSEQIINKLKKEGKL